MGRDLDIRVQSNRFAIAVTFVAGAVGSVTEWARDGFEVVPMLGAGFTAGGAAFLSWAVARELDPDRNLTGYLAAPIGLGVWFFDPPGLLIAGCVLLAARTLADTTGGRLIAADLAAVVALAVVTGLRPGGVIAASALGVAVVADCRLAGHDSPMQYGAGIAAVVGAAVAAVVWADALEFTSLSAVGVLLAAAAAAAGSLTPIGTVSSIGDITRKPLVPSRIRWARLMAVGFVVGYVALGGTNGITTAGPAAAALVALPLGRIER